MLFLIIRHGLFVFLLGPDTGPTIMISIDCTRKTYNNL